MNTITALLRQLRPALFALVAFTLLLGLAYPVAIWGLARIDSGAAEGSIVTDAAGCRVGSAHEAPDLQVSAGAADPYFHSRVVGSSDETDPTAAAMAPGDPAAGSPSNLGPSSPELASWIETRRAVIGAREGVDPASVPVDAVTGSGSGLDPDISPAYAAIQVPRVARENHTTEDQVRALVAAHTSGRQLGFLGQPLVHVTELNIALGLTAPGCTTR